MRLSIRQQEILKKASSKGYINAIELQNLYPVSRETLRKDLIYLEGLGLIERSYGKISFIDTNQNRRLMQDSGILSKSQRKERILELLRNHRDLRISSIAAKLNVSTITIRSDITDLEREGLTVKKHGSVSLINIHHTEESEVAVESPDGKNAILGRHCLLHIGPGDTVYLDGSDVSKYIARGLSLHTNISILTGSLHIVKILQDRRYTAPVYLLPGVISIDSEQVCCLHPRSFLSNIPVQKAFIGVSSYANHTFYLDDANRLESAIHVCKYVHKVYLILDSVMVDKRGTLPFPYTDMADKVQEILVDDGINRNEINNLFSKRDPVVVYGLDYAVRNVKRRKFRIGFLVNRDRNFFIQAVYNSLLEAIGAYNNISLIIRETIGDYASTTANTDILLNEKADLIIDYSLCVESMLYIGEKCRIRGVKLIGVDLQDPKSVYFGADNAIAGMIAGDRTAEFVQKYWSGSLDRIIILTKQGIDPITNLRIMSAVERIQSLISVKVQKPQLIEWDHPSGKALEQLITLLKENPANEKLLFFAFNLRHLLAAHEYIVRHRDANYTILVGQNYNAQIAELMKQANSPIIGCVHYNPEDYGGRIVSLAVRMLEDLPVEPFNYTKHTWVSRDFLANSPHNP